MRPIGNSALSFIRRNPFKLLLACGLALGLALGVFYYRFCNIPRHPPSWTAQKLDLAIDRGLEYLRQSAAFAQRFDQGGEHMVHHFLLDLVLAKAPHPGLRAQQQFCDNLSRNLPLWRSFYGLPGRTNTEFSEADRREIRAQIRDDSRAYARWLLWAVHAAWANLNPEDRLVLFEDSARLRISHDLTHALLAYWLLQRTAPEVALRWQAEDRINQLLPRIERYTAWAPRCGDSYNERVSFTLLLTPPRTIPRRWIERILIVQNGDGGWTMKPPYSRTVREMLGLRIADQPSEPHPTFLALLALTYYRDQLRAGGMNLLEPAE